MRLLSEELWCRVESSRVESNSGVPLCVDSRVSLSLSFSLSSRPMPRSRPSCVQRCGPCFDIDAGWEEGGREGREAAGREGRK